MAGSPISSNFLNECLDEVTERITGLAGRATPRRINDDGLGELAAVSVPEQRRAAKQAYSFSDDTPEVTLVVWDHIWRNSDLLEVMSQALYVYQQRREALTKHEVVTIRGWIDRCSCWGHSDDLSKIYADVVERNPGWMLPTLKRWNRARNPWKRRQSVVAMIEYASKRTRFLPYETMIAQVEALIDDEHYYVQKGVGWTIREIGNAYVDEIRQFLEEHAAQLSPQAWTGATKNMNKTEKARLKALRSVK